MECMRLLAQSVSEEEQRFSEPWRDYTYSAIELSILSDEVGGAVADDRDGAERSVLRHLHPDDLRDWLLATEYNPPKPMPEASLKLVCIPRQLDITLVISKSTFTEILESMKANPVVKYLICRDYDGFHEYRCDGFRLTRFIGTALYALVWTFEPRTMTTIGLFLDRRKQTFDKFCSALSAYQNHISTPSVLCFVSCHFLLQFYDSEAGGWELDAIRHIEEQTGFGPHGVGWRGVEPIDLAKKLNINQLTSWLQAINEIATHAGSRIRHQKGSTFVLERIRMEYETREYYGVSGHALRRYQDSLAALAEVIPALERQLTVYLEYTAYFKERAERLSSVMFALLTHRDAAASIDLAAAARKDSASMKTVAVMTMAFLPATFFAALFAMPSLQWDQPRVVQGHFWVYWAFTLPTTAAVFLVWLLFTERKSISAKISTRIALRKQGKRPPVP
ncbi:hypothetical protein MFIFM68171_11158 [Madurella fahalii]|uniref:Uncharacterized protein n=1 Tax=Madurella fahalii TaxID=1157608 RepID=A0ABQ0GT75_9PEZI